MAEIELREVPLFSGTDGNEVAGIRAIMDVMKFKAGAAIDSMSLRKGVPAPRTAKVTGWAEETRRHTGAEHSSRKIAK